MLQVESNNDPAIRLYRGLGFDVLGTVNRWEAAASRLIPLEVDLSAGPEVRPLARSDWRSAFELDRASVAPDLNWPVPPAPDKYRAGLWGRIDGFLNGRSYEGWVVPATPEHDRRLAGLASIHSEWGRPHRLEIRVHPVFRGRLERFLLAKTMRRLSYLRGGPVQLTHPADDEFLNGLLREAGFRRQRSLTIMRLAILAPSGLD
jgi:hypothetical protein